MQFINTTSNTDISYWAWNPCIHVTNKHRFKVEYYHTITYTNTTTTLPMEHWWVMKIQNNTQMNTYRTDNRRIKNVGMACQKVCKQGRDPSQHLFSILHAGVKKMQGWGFVYVPSFSFHFHTTITFISSLPCLHTFWHAIPTLFCLQDIAVALSTY